MTSQSVQRLNREVEVLQREREDLQQALSDAKNKQPEPQAHTDADYKYLESKLKVNDPVVGLCSFSLDYLTHYLGLILFFSIFAVFFSVNMCFRKPLSPISNNC